MKREGEQNKLISRYLDTIGDGSGTKNAIGDYSNSGLGATQFKIVPAAGQIFCLTRVLITIIDTAGMTAAEYGNLGSPLSNGIEVKEINSNGIISDLTDGIPITANAEWAQICFDVDLKTWQATPTYELLTVRWTFAKSGQLMRLVGNEDCALIFYLNDDFSGLLTHYFLVQGYLETLE